MLPIRNSEVYVLGQHQKGPFSPMVPPPSPPSPLSPAEDDCMPDVADDLRLVCCNISLHQHRQDHGDCELQQPSPPKSPSLSFEELSSPPPRVPAPLSLSRLAGAVHVLNAEASTLRKLQELYAVDPVARDGFDRAVDAITRKQQFHQRREARGGAPAVHKRGLRSARRAAGKVVVIGVGKSGHIAKKLVATFNSLAIHACFLHPTEALHGDLGQIGRDDTLLLITFSGKTPELLLLLPHLDPDLPLVLLTSHTRPGTCEIARRRPDSILLPAPIHEPETASFGVSAPTTSTTAALAVGDAVAIVASQEMHPSVSAVFARNHPGGAIGAAFEEETQQQQQKQQEEEGQQETGSASSYSAPSSGSSVDGDIETAAAPTTAAATSPFASSLPSPCAVSDDRDVRHLAVPLDTMARLSARPGLTAGDVLVAGYASPSGWVRLTSASASTTASSATTVPSLVPPGRIRKLLPSDLARGVDELGWLAAAAADARCVSARTGVRDAAAWARSEGDRLGADSVIAVVDDRGEYVGFAEAGRLLEACD